MCTVLPTFVKISHAQEISSTITLSTPVATAELPPPVEPTASEWASLIKSLGGAKGGSAMVIIVLLVQALMLVLRSKLGEFAGKYRLITLYALTMVGGVIGLKTAGLDWGTALFHSNTLAAFQVLGHQALKQFKEKPTA